MCTFLMIHELKISKYLVVQIFHNGISMSYQKLGKHLSPDGYFTSFCDLHRRTQKFGI